MRVSLIQADLRWHDAAANRAKLEEKINQLSQTDLVILPEMFTTGFSMDAAALAEEMIGASVAWMKQMAQQTQAVVMGSLIIQDNGLYYNRLLWMRPDGTHAQYDKRHLFRMAGETDVYTAGQERLIVELKGWKICPMVCYDLRFPVWARNTPVCYDVLIFIASWPDRRRFAWTTLLQARAIENLAYTVGVNRVGTDAKGHYYSGDSGVYDLLGATLFHAEHQETVETVTLSRAHLEETRTKLPWHLDADSFELRS
ncbi:amidohydrolase [Nibribacter ruber]|uniref:Omega-amidase YafV n=1 Tax=Nibribacter ruber TaxID=2698458 RepID=A0A6P1P4V6_9BACT|nr:amidohydrolase [Nibribacter ruber]